MAHLEPQWFADLTERRWYEFTGGPGFGASWQNGATLESTKPSNHASIPGTHDDLVRAFTGGCASQIKKWVILPAQGGHAAWGGNDIYALKLFQAVPAWERIKDSSTPANISATNAGNFTAYCANTDNTPRSQHGWNQCHVDAEDILWIGQSAPRDDGTGTVNICYWSIPLNNLGAGWTYRGRMWVQPADGGADTDLTTASFFFFQASPGAIDLDNNRVWRTPEQDVTGNPRARAIKCYLTADSAAAATTGNNLIAHIDKFTGGNAIGDVSSAASCILGNKAPRSWLIQDGNNIEVLSVEASGDFVQITPSGTGPGTNALGCIYVPQHSAAYFFGTELGAVVKKLTITGKNPLTASYAWSAVTNNGGSATPTTDTSPYNGTFSKAQGILSLGGNQAALVIASGWNAPCYVYKLPTS